MRLFDCFMYGGEEELLELRISLLRAHVDCFVVVESDQTFTGRPRQIVGESVLRRHLRSDQYRFIAVSEWPDGGAWAREAHQRNAILHGLVDADARDMIVIADVDEIPNPEILARIRYEGLGSGNLEMVWHAWAYNLAYPKLWSKAKVLSRADLDTPQSARQTSLPTTYAKGGWHLSWIMSSSDSMRKIESFSHAELDRAALKDAGHIDRCISQGVDLIGRSLLTLVPEDRCVPGALQFGLRRADDIRTSSGKRYLLVLEAAGRAWMPPAGRIMPRWMYVLAGVPRVLLVGAYRAAAQQLEKTAKSLAQ